MMKEKRKMGERRYTEEGGKEGEQKF